QADRLDQVAGPDGPEERDVPDLHPDVRGGGLTREVPERGGLDAVVLVAGVGEVVLDDEVELVVDAALDPEPDPPEEGGRGPADPARAAVVRKGEGAIRGDQPGRVDLGVAPDVYMAGVVGGPE